MVKTKKRNTINNNKTKKCKYSQKELTKYCRNFANTFNQFEKEYEKKFNSHLEKTDTDIEKYLIKMFNTPFTPSKYTPRNDFYTWINYTWIRNQEVTISKTKKHYVQIDDFRITQEKVYYQLIDIIKNYIKNNTSKTAEEISDLYKSCMLLCPEAAKSQVDKTIRTIDKFMKNNDLYGLLTNINSNEIISWGSPIVWNVLPDQKQSTIYRSVISAPQLTAFDYELYFEELGMTSEDIKYKKEYKRNFLKYLDNLFEKSVGKNHGINIHDIWETEKDILNAMLCNKIKDDDMEGYNLVNPKELLDLTDFDWNRFAKLLGYDKVPNKIICTNLNYIKCIMNNLVKDDNWKKPKWRAYFIYIHIRQIARFNANLLNTHFEFHEKFVKGQSIPWPREIYSIFGMSFCFNTFLTNEYIDNYKRQQYIDYVHNMATDLLIVFKRIIKRNKWLSPNTKKSALLKLDHIKLTVGSPKKLRRDPLLNYDPRDAYGNLVQLAKWRFNQFIQLEGQPIIDIPVIDWAEFKLISTQAYIVNAFYTPTENAIYIPLAYLQQPFIDLEERGIEYNLAHIGWTLAHEMSHALDDSGSKYDYKGNLNNWWTDSDRHKFDLKVKNVIKQYETFTAYDGIKMDGSLSTGENLADISGLAICVEYLRDFQVKNNDIVPICSLSFEAFFTYIAVQGRQKIQDEAFKAQLKTNPHPMDKYRTNCPLSRLELFRSLYNIKKGDKMYWENTDTIW
jgi:putative endopeptidase